LTGESGEELKRGKSSSIKMRSPRNWLNFNNSILKGESGEELKRGKSSSIIKKSAMMMVKICVRDAQVKASCNMISALFRNNKFRYFARFEIASEVYGYIFQDT
jgi:hypothetical protein